MSKKTELRTIFSVYRGGKDFNVKNDGWFLNRTVDGSEPEYIGFTPDGKAAARWEAGGPLPKKLIEPIRLTLAEDPLERAYALDSV